MLSCKKDSDTTRVRINLTDAPAEYDEVNVDIREVNIKTDGDTSGWVSVPTKAGIYNLLEYQDGVDTLIAEALLTGNAIKEIRLVLGDDNTIKKDGESFPLTIPSGSESGLKIKLQQALSGGIADVTLDFDAALSVKSEESGYKLRPVVKILPWIYTL
ncbi:MAG: DUF4382 domain-containing protein [Chitinophagaceae bacterium]|nr:DUF4382 domain-containing protein [Chitinophagaceae bacterium]